jgi:hypothetical protein
MTKTSWLVVSEQTFSPCAATTLPCYPDPCELSGTVTQTLGTRCSQDHGL